ncbi:TMEM63A [Symbiodinium necroappetens]|uniref:TMEM63A protein n=1 Tax=Symbiodinium necroappetens TaxID=1628268 RepID=A0A813B7Y3_9DINO|nr:TMEM63A [Symbiodinium necroappetens]
MDESVYVRRLFEHARDQEHIREKLQISDEKAKTAVFRVHVPFVVDKWYDLDSRQKETLARLKMKRDQLSTLQAELHQHCLCRCSPRLRIWWLSRQVRRLERKTQDLKHELDDMELSAKRMSGSAFVTFQERKYKATLLEDIPSCWKFHSYAYFNFGQLPFSSVTLRCRRAPHPADVLWENLHIPYYKRLLIDILRQWVDVCGLSDEAGSMSGVCWQLHLIDASFPPLRCVQRNFGKAPTFSVTLWSSALAYSFRTSSRQGWRLALDVDAATNHGRTSEALPIYQSLYSQPHSVQGGGEPAADELRVSRFESASDPIARPHRYPGSPGVSGGEACRSHTGHLGAAAAGRKHVQFAWPFLCALLAELHLPDQHQQPTESQSACCSVAAIATRTVDLCLGILVCLHPCHSDHSREPRRAHALAATLWCPVLRDEVQSFGCKVSRKMGSKFRRRTSPDPRR